MNSMNMRESQGTDDYDDPTYRGSRSTMGLMNFLPKKKRSSTDKCWMILLFLMWLGMTLIGLASIGKIKIPYIKEGNPSYLLHGVDYEGNICGVSSEVSHLPKQVYPNYYGTNTDSKGQTVPKLTAICVSSCPAQNDVVTDPYGNYGSWTITEKTVDFVNTCLYMKENRITTSGTTIISDMLNTYPIIAILGFCLAIICSIGFLFVTRIPMFLRSVVWSCVFIIFLICLGGGYFLINTAKNQNNRAESDALNNTEVELLNALGIALCTVGVLWMCFICFLRKRISLAIQIIRESAAALIHMPLLLFLPIFQTFLFAAFTCLWLYYTIYLISSGDITTHVDSTTGISYKTVSYDVNSQRAILFMLFSWLWTIGFIEAMGQLSSAHCVLKWYFAEVRKDITSCQIFSSICCMMRYHTGTAALGSLLITCIRGVRLVLEYVKYHTAKASGASSSLNCMNRLVLCVFCCFQCLLGWFEKFIKFLNKHAYIQTAMKGSSFMPSALNAFRLLVKNVGRFAAVTVISDLVVFIGKLSISLTCAALGYLFLTSFMSEKLNGFVLPTVFIFFLAYFTCTMFLGVLSATADTLLQACLVDEEYIHSGNAEKYHKSLKELVVEQKDHWRSENQEYDYCEDEEFYLEEMEDDYERSIELPRYRSSRSSGASSVVPPVGNRRYEPLSEERKEEIYPVPPPAIRSPWLDEGTRNVLQSYQPEMTNNVDAFNPGGRNNRYATKK